MGNIELQAGNAVERKEEGSKKRGDIKEYLEQKYFDLGVMEFKERIVAFYFVCLVIIWFFEEPEFIQGWADYVTLDDGSGAVEEAINKMVRPQRKALLGIKLVVNLDNDIIYLCVISRSWASNLGANYEHKVRNDKEGFPERHAYHKFSMCVPAPP